MMEAAAGQPGARSTHRTLPTTYLAPAKAPPRPTKVPSEVEGVVAFVCTEVEPGEVVPENRKIVAKCWMLAIRTDKKDIPHSERLIVPSGTKGVVYRKWRPEDGFAPDSLQVGYVLKTYRKLNEGERVKEGQLLALVDSALERDQLEIGIAKLDAAELELKVSTASKVEAECRIARMNNANSRTPGTFSPEEVDGATVTWKRYVQGGTSNEGGPGRGKTRSRSEANTRLEKCASTSPESGVVKAIQLRKGEAVKRLETVLEIQPLDDK